MSRKYRPYLTLPDLKAILEALQSHTPHNLKLYRYLYKYASDIEAGTRQENYRTEPTLAQRLEFEPVEPFRNFNIPTLLTAYHAHGFVGMNPAQIETLQRHRYENDLMTPEEEAEFLRSIGVHS